MVKSKSKSKGRAKKQNTPKSNSSQIASQFQDLKKAFLVDVAAMKAEFKNKLEAVIAMTNQKARLRFEREFTKLAQEKAKTLRDMATTFNNSLQARFSTTPTAKTTKKGRKTKATTSKRGRPTKTKA